MKYLVFIVSFFGSVSIFAQEGKIKWMSFEEAVKVNEKNPKKFIIDIYTNWCGWCKRMDATTFSNPVIVQYINEKFHAVKLNAEMTDTVVLGEQIFVNENNGQRKSPHQLAIALMNGKMSYPTMVYLDENVDMLQPLSGYHDAKAIEPILKYFGENAYKTVEWPAFQTSFQGEVVSNPEPAPKKRETVKKAHYQLK